MITDATGLMPVLCNDVTTLYVSLLYSDSVCLSPVASLVSNSNSFLNMYIIMSSMETLPQLHFDEPDFHLHY